VSLSEYEQRRDFAATPEPAPDAPVAAATRRFVIQEHHATSLHWDLRLEHEGVLASWALPRGIPPDPRQNRLAVRTEDHPLAYLEFEGEIPKGQYGGGLMEIWDSGTYQVEKFRDREVIVVLHGERVTGRYALFRTEGRNWMIHRMDPPDDPGRELMPEGIAPMLAKPGSLPPHADDWAFEIKWSCLSDRNTNLADRIMGYTSMPSVTLISCGGVWDPSAGTHDKRVAVRGELIKAA